MIQTEQDYEAARQELLVLMDVKSPTEQQDRQFEELVEAIGAYEAKHYPQEAEA